MSAALHWLAYWSVGALIVGGAGAAAWFSPFFKQAFIGVAAGAALLMAAQNGLVSFRPKAPVDCINPAVDPNGPTSRCWHATDEQRGYGYWGACGD